MRKIIKNILPIDLIQRIKAILAKLDFLIITVAAKSSVLSSFYYCCLSRQFRREHQAVLQGRLEYERSLLNIGNSSVLLRRNIHRLEKGLIMQPKKSVFAINYIEETVNCFIACSRSPSHFSKSELKWANDVLNRYFSEVTLPHQLSHLTERFSVVKLDVVSEHSISSPYLASQRERSNIGYEQLKLLFKQRRSVRWYQDVKVDIDLIKKGIEIASLAPSACNRQPFSFYTIVDPKLAQEIASIPMGTVGFSQNVQSLIIVIGDLSAYPFERDRHIIYLDGGLVSMQLMLALEVLGLSSCPINWPDIDFYEKKLIDRLNLELFQRPVMMISIGYPLDNGGVAFSQKKSSDELVKVVVK